jgi:hypothetical protein
MVRLAARYSLMEQIEDEIEESGEASKEAMEMLRERQDH